MALHNMVWNGETKTSEAIPLTPDEETAELARWAMEDAIQAQKKANPIPTTEERIVALEQTINALKEVKNAT